MRILDRYVCREVVSDSWLGLAVFTFVFFVPQLVRLMSLVVQHAATAKEIATLLLCSLPPVLIFTVPMSMLVGVLIGLGRFSADSEIVALNASGVSLRRLLVPVGAIALTATILTFCITLWLGPASLRILNTLEDHLRVSQASFAVQPRVFDEQFPHIVLYIEDVGASGLRWRGVFLADSSSSTGSKVTVARNAIVITDERQGKFTIHFNDVSTHTYDPKNPDHYDLSTSAEESTDLPLRTSDATASGPQTLNDRERTIHQLLSVRGTGMRSARVEFQERIALPIACLIFAFLGVPVGVRPRRGGRAAGFVLTIVLICGYYLFFVTGVHFAQNGVFSPIVGVWTANLVTLAVGLILLRRIEHIHPETRWIDRLRRNVLHQPKIPPAAKAADSLLLARAALQIERPSRRRYRTWSFPLIFDLYVLGAFFYWVLLMLVSFMVLFDAFTLFDLLGDIAKNHISLAIVASYFAHLLPMMIYQLLPLAVLVATLITLGLLAKNNEITAFKASGISMFRLALPLVFAGILLSAGMFLLDDTLLPYANQRQDALHDRIKGRPAETYFQPNHQWIFGEHDKIYNYQLFDPYGNLFDGLNVFELNSSTFQVQRRIYANRAYWEPSLDSWILERGWVRDFSTSSVTSFKTFRVDSFSELSEHPSYFKREVFQYNQMNWWQLRNYIRSLQEAGFETARLSVEWHKKFAFPLIAAIIVFLAIPFALLVGTRGAVGGIALAVGIGIAYWSIAALFEALGTVGQLPPFMAAWAPDAIFAFAGLYFFLKMPN